jgi:hypothetical protein
LFPILLVFGNDPSCLPEYDEGDPAFDAQSKIQTFRFLPSLVDFLTIVLSLEFICELLKYSYPFLLEFFFDSSESFE